MHCLNRNQTEEILNDREVSLMFSDLLLSNNLSPAQMKKAASLSKKFSPTNKADLEKAYHLLFSLFCTNRIQETEICLDVLTQLKFNGNFNLWTFIEPSYCLKFFLTRDESVKQEITRMLREDVKSKWDDEDEHQEWIQKILDGELVKNAQEQLDRYIEDGIKTEYIWRVSLLTTYLHVLALGATGALNPSVVNDAINQNLARLREISAA